MPKLDLSLEAGQRVPLASLAKFNFNFNLVRPTAECGATV
jgi:hypothetical protein